MKTRVILLNKVYFQDKSDSGSGPKLLQKVYQQIFIKAEEHEEKHPECVVYLKTDMQGE